MHIFSEAWLMITAIDGGYIVAFDGEEHRILRDGTVVVEDDTIKFVGKSYGGPVDCRIDARRSLVSPGFIALHSHICGGHGETGRRGDGSRRQLYNSDLFDRMFPRTKEGSRAAAELNYVEVLKSGCTTLVELGSPNALGNKEAVKLPDTLGNRTYLLRTYASGSWHTPDGNRVLYTNFDGETWDEAPGFKGLEESKAFIKKYDGSADGRIKCLLGPSTVDMCSPELFRESRKAADEMGVGLQTHVSQSVVEFQEIMRRHGMTPMELLHEVGLLGPDLIAGHSILIGGHSKVGYADPWRRDIRLLAETGTTVAHCPHVFARYGVALESYARYLMEGVNIGIGTDTYPMDIIREMGLAATISKIVEGEPGVATSRDLFNSVTLSAAKALGRGDLGRIAPGCKADIVIVKMNSINMSPVRDPIRNLVMSGNNGDVTTVMIDGRVVVEDGRVPGVDEEKLAENLQREQERIWDMLPSTDVFGRTVDEITPPSFKAWEDA
jgi:cytosine/adenosine deaminase-related metal-dependent hydrolase